MNNDHLLLKMVWAGYSTQQVHHLLKLYPELLTYSYRSVRYFEVLGTAIQS